MIKYDVLSTNIHLEPFSYPIGTNICQPNAG